MKRACLEIGYNMSVLSQVFEITACNGGTGTCSPSESRNVISNTCGLVKLETH